MAKDDLLVELRGRVRAAGKPLREKREPKS
jgi:hypothetical protein